MSRAGTFLRLVRDRDREAIGQVLTRSLFPPWAFRRNTMLLARLVHAKPLPRPLPRVAIRWGTRADEADLIRIRPREGGYGKCFDDGHLLLVGTIDGAVASFNWFELTDPHRSPANGYTFGIGADGAWAFGFEVDPAHRMSGIFHKHWVEAMSLLAERGVRRVYGSIQADNPRSVNSHRRLGFEILFEFHMIRVLGVETYRVISAQDAHPRSARGFGNWSGTDPLV